MKRRKRVTLSPLQTWSHCCSSIQQMKGRTAAVRRTTTTSSSNRHLAVLILVLLFLTILSPYCRAFVPSAATGDILRKNWSHSTSIPTRITRLAVKQKDEESSSSSQSNYNNNLFATTTASSERLNAFNNNDKNGKQEKTPSSKRPRRKMELMWCGKDYCKDVIRERMVNEHVLLNGPATGQVAYYWSRPDGKNENKKNNSGRNNSKEETIIRYVLLLVRPGDDQLLEIAARAIKAWTNKIDSNESEGKEIERHQRQDEEDQIHIMLDPTTAARLEHNYGVRSDCIHLFEPQPTPGFGSHLSGSHRRRDLGDPWDPNVQESIPTPFDSVVPDLIVTLGGDGLLMHASMMFQGPIPPILCVAGGSLGFLTPFKCDEMVDAVRIALGMISSESSEHTLSDDEINNGDDVDNVFPPNMPSYPYDPLPKNPTTFGSGARVCLSIRMRLCCQIMNRDGVMRAQFNVLNEVVIDRGSSPYLAALECFCDDVHLTTVQADGIIFATPTGSTAYSMAAGGSVVHPAVPCILVTPICPHVLSFRSMVFPDHVVLRCYVPDDARNCASVAFDGKHRQELRRGESVQIRLSAYPVPTLNRYDHSSDWLGSLKQNFNFNSRPRQRPL